MPLLVGPTGKTITKMTRMKKTNMCTIAALLIALFAHSQPSAEAKSLLDKTYAAVEASKGIRLTFRAATLGTDRSKQLSMEGVAFIRGNKFRLETRNMIIWFDGTTQWVLMKEVNEVNISHPSGQEIASVSPLALLGIYQNGYTLKAPVTKTLNGKSVYLIGMVPAVGNGAYKAVEAAIDKISHTLVQVTLTLRDGTKQVIELSNYNANHNFTDSEFQFDKTHYPHAEIIDLR